MEKKHPGSNSQDCKGPMGGDSSKRSKEGQIHKVVSKDSGDDTKQLPYSPGREPFF